MVDRKPTYKNRITLTRQDGSQETVTWAHADNPLVEGTPLSKATLMPDDVGALVCSGVPDPTPADAFRALAGMLSVTVTLPVSGWTGSTAPYTQTISVSGMNGDWKPGIPGVVNSTNASLAERIETVESYRCLNEIVSAAGALTFICYDSKPKKTITVTVPGIVERGN